MTIVTLVEAFDTGDNLYNLDCTYDRHTPSKYLPITLSRTTYSTMFTAAWTI